MKALQSGYWLLLLATLTLTAITASPLGFCHDKVDGATFPIVGTCTTYIYCLHENAIVITCPLGEGFSQASHGCLTKAKSDCALQTTTLPFDGAINTTLGSCLANEQRTENKVACMGQAFGELMPYPGNCSRFLVCNCEYPTVKNCSGGLWFNNAAKVCDWPQNVNCSNDVITPPIECTPLPGISANVCEESKDGTLLRYPYNCNAYVNCTVGCPVLKYCDKGKVFNELLKICDTPDTATCEDEPIPTTTPSSTNESTTEDPTTPHVCDEPPFGVENYFCTHQPEGSFHNYPYNCTAYVECRGGCAKLDYCEPGKIFNNILDICDTPNSVVCHEIPYPGSSTTATEAPVTDSSTINPNLPPVINPTSCVNRPDHTLVPYPDNCDQYIECMTTGNIVHTCPDGSVFNPNLLICDQAAHDNCHGISTDRPTLTAATPSLPPVVFEKCLNSPKGTTYSYHSDCQLYYYCWGNNTSSLLSCPNNNYYNPQTGNCGPDVSSTACQESVTTIAPTINPETVCENQLAGSTFPVHSNCAQYKMCEGGGGYITLNCPNNNYYNPNTGNCGPNVSPTACQEARNVSPTPTSSTPKPTSKILSNTVTANICENVPNFSIVPDSQNCSQFIVCMNMNLMFVECAEGEYFDPSIGNCDTTATSETCTNWHYTQTVAPHTPPTSTPTLKGICGNYTQGELLAYPGNCTKYIVCVNPAPVAFSCPNSWYFNELMQQCDLPKDTNCSENGVTTAPNDGITTASPRTDVCNGATNGTTFPYTQNCQIFIRCSGNNFYLYDICNDQGYYDPISKECGADVSTNACNGDSSIPIPSEPPELTGVCAGQTPGSKIPYPENCSKYIVCVLPIPIGYECGENLEFSSELQACTTPENANCGSSGGIIGETTTTTESTAITSAPKTCADLPNASTLPYPEDCSKYIVCLNGQPMLVQCNSNSYYNVQTGDCDQQTSATACQESSETTTPFPSTESTAKPSTEVPTVTSEPKTCADLPNDSTLPYADDCSQYYVCLNGQAMLVQCNPNQYYNAQTGNCDAEISETDCKIIHTTTTEVTAKPELTTITSSETTFSASTTESTTEKVTETIESTTRLETSTTEEVTTVSSVPQTCADLSNGATLPYPADCSKYIVCINGHAMVTVCMPNQYYNPQTGNCDGQTSETACRNNGTTTTEVTSNSETSTAKTDYTTISETTSITATTDEHYISTQYTTIQPDHENCLDQPVGTTFSYTENCRLYYYCWGNNTSSLLFCPTNNYYNPQTGRCGPEVSSTACQEPVITTVTPEITTTQSVSTHSDSATETTTETATTTNENTARSETSVTDEFTTVTYAPKTCASLTNGATLPYPTDCSKYIVCVNGQEMVTECISNQYYNVKTGNCDSQTSETDCRNSDTTTPGETSTPELTTSTHSAITTETTTEEGATTNEITARTSTPDEFTTTPSAPKTCASLKNGATLPYPTDCSKYIVCVNGQEVVTACMPNQYYNVNTGNCNSQTSETACRNSDTTLPGATSTPDLTTTTQSLSTNTAITTETTTKEAATTNESTQRSETSTPDEFTTITSSPKTCASLTNGVTLPYPTDCSKYIVCVNGQEVVTACMPNQYYNVNTGNCDSQTSETACRNSDTTLPGATSTPDLTTTTQSLNTNTAITTETTTKEAATTNESTERSETSTPDEFTTITSSPKTCASLKNGATLPYPTDCSKYIVCVNGQEMVTECMPNQYYNVKTGNCDSQTSETDCRNGDTTISGATSTTEVTTTTQSDTTHAAGTTEATTEITTTNESTTLSETSTPNEFTTVTYAPKTCASLTNGATLPYPTDCSKYIVCVNGQEMVTECMPNQYYNPQTGNCDGQTSETACRNNDTITTETSSGTTTTVAFNTSTTEEMPTTKYKETSTTAEDITTMTTNPCVDLPNNYTLPYSSDCSKYIKCLNGQEVLVPCIPDTYYNIQSGKCDEKTSETACRDSDTTTRSTEVPDTSTTGRDKTTNSELPTSAGISTTDNTRTGTSTLKPFYENCLDQSIGTTFSYTEDCHLYYYCWGNNTSSLLPCPNNNFYNPVTGRCGPEVSSTACQELVITTTPADVTENTSKYTTSTSSPKTCANLPNGATLPYPEDCSKYEQCLNGQEILVQCMTNTYYNMHTSSCDAQISNTACRDDITTTQTSDDTTTSVDINTSSKNYDSTTEQNSLSTNSKETTPENEKSTDSATKFTTSSENTTTPSSTDKTTSTVTPKSCIDEPNGTSLPYYNDCSKYIICLNGKENMAQCIPNTFYNIQTGNCERQTSNTTCNDITTTTLSTKTVTPLVSTVLSTISEESTSFPAFTTTVSTTTDDTSSTAVPNFCTGIINGKTLPYLDDCSEYIICWNDHEILTKCPAKTFYNILTGDCDAHSSNTSCHNSITTKQATDGTTSSPKETKHTGTFESTTDKVTATIDLSSTSSGLTTNFPESVMSSTEGSTTTSTPNSCTGLESGTTLPYISDCSLYIFCFKNKEIIALCMPDTYFDVYSGYCNNQSSDSGCRESTTPTISIKTETVTKSSSERTSTSISQKTTLEVTSTMATTTTNKETTTSIEASTPVVTTYTLETTVDDTSSSAAPNSCTGVPNGTSLPYLSDCSKYIICWNNQVILTQCKQKTYFNILTGDCDAKMSKTSCNDKTTTTVSSQKTDGTTISPETTMNTNGHTTNHPEITTTSIDSTIEPNSCTGLESGVTLPYLNDCSLYIFCFKNKEILAICSPNTYYDILTSNCNHLTSDSACRDGTTTEIYVETTSTPKTYSISTTMNDATATRDTTTSDIFTSTPPTVTFTLEPTSSSTDDTSSSVASNSCTGVPNGKSIPYLRDCSKYIICWNNQVILTQCLPNTFYNVQTETCNKQTSKTSCRDTTTTTTTTTSAQTMTTDINISTSKDPPHTTASIPETTTLIEPCYDKPNGYQIPYPNNCSKYIICNDLLPVGHDCPDTLEFNADMQECVLSDLANCSVKNITTTVDPTSTSIDPMSTKPNPRVTTVDPTSTSTDLRSTTLDPPVTTLDPPVTTVGTPVTTIDPILTTTDPISTTLDPPMTTVDPTLTTVAINICLNQQNGIRFPYGNNCTGFVYCENGAERYELCQAGYYYNPSVDACDNNVSPEVCLDFEITTTALPTTTYDPTESTTTTLNPHTPNVCCGKPLGTRVIYPDNCSKYITCAYPVPIVGQCPINTSFDTGTLQCVSSNLAQCRASTGQSAIKISTAITAAMQPITTTPSNIILQGECSYLPSGSQLVYIGDCSKYNFCFGGQSYVLSCSENFYFNPNRKQCVPSYKCPWYTLDDYHPSFIYLLSEFMSCSCIFLYCIQ